MSAKRELRKEKYKMLREVGFSSKDATKMKDLKLETVKEICSGTQAKLQRAIKNALNEVGTEIPIQEIIRKIKEGEMFE